jgi:hypothetical protein
MASVYWLPPAAMSRLKTETPPFTTFTFMIDAPMFRSATTRPGSMP